MQAVRSERHRNGRASVVAGRRDDKTHKTLGQALVEFALIIPVMLLLVVGGLDVGRLFFSWIEVSNAAREAAAYGGGNPTDTTGMTIHANLEANAQTQGGEGSMTVSASCKDPTNAPLACSLAAGGNSTGNTITVQVTRPFSFVTPLIGNLLGSSLNLTGSATSAVYGMQPNDGSSAPDPCDPPSSASFSWSASVLTVTVDGSSATPNSGRCAIATYDWDWGDGVTVYPPAEGKQTSYTYGSGSTYTLTLTVSNPGGSLSSTHVVTVPPPGPTATPSPTPTPTPTDTASPSPTNPCSMTPTFTYTKFGNSGKFNFFGAYTGQPAPASWFWWFGDGDVGGGQAPAQHRYTGSGPYTVTLMITNGSCQATVSEDVYP